MHVKGLARAATIAITLLSGTAISNAGETIASLVAAGMEVLCAPFAAKVSASEGNFKSRSKYGCLGAFQFCPGTFEVYYKGTADQFLNSPSDQVVAWSKYERTQWALAAKYQLTALVGSEVCVGSQCEIITPSAILMACQFGCGNKGKLANYAKSRNCDARNVKDGNLVSVCNYLIKGVGYVVSCFTGQPTPAVLPTPVTPASTLVCPPPNEIARDRLEVAVNNFTLRFDESTSSDALRRVLEILRSTR